MRLLCAGVLSAVMSAASYGQVPFERIVNADKEPGNWLTYSRDLLGHRYSPLNEITSENVANLKVKWAFQFPSEQERGISNRRGWRHVRYRAKLGGCAGRAHGTPALELESRDPEELSQHRFWKSQPRTGGARQQTLRGNSGLLFGGAGFEKRGGALEREGR